MTLLDRYVLREWLKVFVMTLVALVALLLIVRVFTDMPGFMRWDSAAGVVLGYFALQVPAYLPVVLPVALLISVLFILGHFHRNHELTAMRAAGLSVFRVTRTLWVGGGALSLLLFALNATLVPLATEYAQWFAETAEFDFHSREGGAVGGGAGGAGVVRGEGRVGTQFYVNNSARRIWGINRFSGYTGRGYGVFVYQNDARGRPVEAWLARYGYFDEGRGHWVLEDGRHLRFDGVGGKIVAEPAFKRLALPGLVERPRVMLALNKKPRDLSIRELGSVLEHAGGERTARMAAWAVQYHYVLASPFCCLVVIGLAIPFAVSGVRVNPMVGVSKSLVLFALYYLLSNVFAILGTQQHLAPMLAAWLPNLFMLAFAAWLCRRVN
jgi:lipopolysaccharide export system permease protein